MRLLKNLVKITITLLGYILFTPIAIIISIVAAMCGIIKSFMKALEAMSFPV